MGSSDCRSACAGKGIVYAPEVCPLSETPMGKSFLIALLLLAPGEDDSATQSAMWEKGTGSSVQSVQLVKKEPLEQEPPEQEPPATPAADLGNAAQDLGELWTE